ncbi:MAG: hypothetical protein J6V24_03880 [Clostridia bacterium]|nr:hypothetical protein [Clostridia bacterium]
MTTDYLIAVDAGGTKTRALAYRADDFTPIPDSETLAGPGNLADSPEDAVRSILDAASRCSEAAKAVTGGSCLHLTLGAAGFSAVKPDSPAMALLDKGLTPFSPYETRVNDALLALHANFDTDEAGMIVISGTGSAVFCQERDMRFRRAGGWGNLLGDGGSAFSVSRDAVRRLLALLDEGRVRDAETFFALWRDALSPEVPFFASCATGALIAFAMHRPKRDLAALAPGIVELAQRNGTPAEIRQTCLEILSEEMAALAADTGRLFTALKRQECAPCADHPLPVVLTGGFFTHNPLCRTLFRDHLAGYAVPVVFREAADPTRAVIRHYRESLRRRECEQ